SRIILAAVGNPAYRALTMNAFLPEPMICGELDFHRNDLTDGRQRQLRTIAPPGDEQPAPTDVLREHRTAHPQCRRGYMAAELDVDSGALTPVYVLHLVTSDTGESTAAKGSEQYRKWAIPFCCPRLATQIAAKSTKSAIPASATFLGSQSPEYPAYRDRVISRKYPAIILAFSTIHHWH